MNSAPNDRSVSVIIPAKNEAASIADVVRETLAVLPQAQVLVIDDGSTDATGELAAGAGAEVIRMPYSCGNGAAVKTGFRAAGGDILVTLDGDGQHRPSDIPSLLEPLSNGYAMAVGARERSTHASLGRRLANGFYNRLSSWMVGHKIEDLTSGFRAVLRDRATQFLHLLPNGFSYPTTLTMAMFRSAFPVAYVPIHARQRQGKSHIRIGRDGLRFLLIIFRVTSFYSPLKIFFPASGLLAMAGTSYYLYTYFTIGRFTNMGTVLLIAAVLVFLIGLVSEQVTALMFRDPRD